MSYELSSKSVYSMVSILKSNKSSLADILESIISEKKNIDSWIKGDASKAFVLKYESAENKLKKNIEEMSTQIKKLNNVADELKTREEAKKKAEEEAKRRAREEGRCI